MVKKILVVDDDVDVRTVLEVCLREEGFEVKTAGDGLSAANMTDEESFDAIVTDIIMPRMGGLEFAAHIKECRLNSQTPIFVIAGNSDSAALLRAKELGVVSVAPKPFDIIEFVKAIKLRLAQQTLVTTYNTDIITSFSHATCEVFLQHLGDKPDVESVASHRGPVINSFASVVIGLGGSQHRGLMSLSLGQKLLREFCEAILKDVGRKMTDGLAADIAGEIGNQIAQRIKVKLLKLGIHVEVGLPQVIFGVGHKIVHRTGGSIIRIQFKRKDTQFMLDYSLVNMSAMTKS